MATASSASVLALIDTDRANALTARQASPVFSPASDYPAQYIQLAVGESRQLPVPTGSTPISSDTAVATVSFSGLGRVFRNWMVTGVATGYSTVRLGTQDQTITVYVA